MRDGEKLILAAIKRDANRMEKVIFGGAWPKPGSLVHVTRNRHRYYRALNGEFDGDLPGSTSVLKAVLGLSTENLMDWAALEERKASLKSALKALDASDPDSMLRLTLGKEGGYAHRKRVKEAGDIGTEIHALAENWLKAQIGLDHLTGVPSNPEAGLAFLAFKDRWQGSGLNPVLVEQPVYDTDWGYAGTIDILAECPQRGLGVIDLKSNKKLYQDKHLQVASYLKAGRNFADLKWAELWRLPKVMGNLEVEVKPLGEMYDRILSPEQCEGMFRAALLLFQGLIHKEDK